MQILILPQLLTIFLLVLGVKSQQEEASIISNEVSSDDKTPPTSIPLRYVAGVYQVPEAPNSLPVIYDSYFPIVFEFSLPKWDIHTMKIQFWKDHNNCTTSDNYVNGYPCPIMFHFNSIIDYFVGNMTMWTNLFLDDSLPPEQLLGLKTSGSFPTPGIDPDVLDLPLIFSRNHSGRSLILDQEYYCGKVVSHFATFQTSRAKMDAYYGLLDRCGNARYKEVIKDLGATSSALEELYHKTFASYVTDYWDKLPPAVGRQSSTVNIWTALETALLLHQYMESQKWTKAVGSCQQSQIPWTLVGHERLVDAIKAPHALFDEGSGNQLSIPVHELSKYYKLPLTDCVFVDKDTLAVRILVPYRKKQPSESLLPPQILRFEPIVFHENDQFCWIDGARGQKYVEKDGILFVTDCSSDQDQTLCRIPPGLTPRSHLHQEVATPCAQALHDDDEEAIVEYCYLRCVPASRKNKMDGKRHHPLLYNFVHTMDDSYLYSVANEENSLTVECPNTSSIQLKKTLYTAWNLTLACGCKISDPVSAFSFEINTPCHDQFHVEKIRPYHWRNVHLKKSNKKLEALKSKSKAPWSGAESPDLDSEDAFVVMLDRRYGAYTLHYVVLWLVILALCAVIGILSFFVLQLRKWRQHELFKENRLIYSNALDSREQFAMEGPHQHQHHPR